jgi:hypothetical protein
MTEGWIAISFKTCLERAVERIKDLPADEISLRSNVGVELWCTLHVLGPLSGNILYSLQYSFVTIVVKGYNRLLDVNYLFILTIVLRLSKKVKRMKLNVMDESTMKNHSRYFLGGLGPVCHFER